MDTVRAAAKPAAVTMCCIAGALWTILGVSHVFAFFWLRNMVAQMRRVVSADDAYRRFEESSADLGSEAGVFAVDDDDDKDESLIAPRESADDNAVIVGEPALASTSLQRPQSPRMAGLKKPPPPAAVPSPMESKKSKKSRKKDKYRVDPTVNEFTGV